MYSQKFIYIKNSLGHRLPYVGSGTTIVPQARLCPPLIHLNKQVSNYLSIDMSIHYRVSCDGINLYKLSLNLRCNNVHMGVLVVFYKCFLSAISGFVSVSRVLQKI